MAAEQFAIRISDAVLADLARRIDTTRWPDELENAGWEYGSNLAYMRSLAEYWRHSYDWRREEAILNRLPQFRLAIEGFHIHFVHVRGKGAGAPSAHRDAWMARKLCRDAQAHAIANGSDRTWRQRGGCVRRDRAVIARLWVLRSSG